MDDITSLRVGLGARAYDIKIGNNLIANAGDLLGDIIAGRQAVIVSDSNVASLHLDALASSLSQGHPALRQNHRARRRGKQEYADTYRSAERHP